MLSKRLQKRIEKHAFTIKGPLTHPFEALHMGNGDIGANINFYPHEVKIALAKADIWDARYDGTPEASALKQDDLIRMMAKENRDLVCAFKNDRNDPEDFLLESPAYFAAYGKGPSPKRAGVIRVYHPGLSNTRVSGRLDILTGILTVTFRFAKGELVVRAFIQKTKNLIFIEIESIGDAPWAAIVLEKEPDDADSAMEHPLVQMATPYLGGISQSIPGGLNIPPFTWAIAGAFPNESQGVDSHIVEEHAYRLRQYCGVKSGCKAHFCVAIATSRDGGDPFGRAVSMACESAPRYEQCLKEHIAAWAAFWAASTIGLDDNALEAAWHRDHFGYGCALAPGMVPPGSGGNITNRDILPWHGDCHMNHNFQKWFVTALPTNHAEWIDIYADFIQAKMPVFEYQANLIFGLEGVYCDLAYLPVMSAKHCHINNYMGRSLAVTGWLGQPLWWHYEYTRDKVWLKRRGYPYLKKAAQFYWRYLEKYMDETDDIFPSMRLEEPGWKKGFIGNRNVITDLVMFKNAFEWAIQAAEALGVDAMWRARWQKALLRVPAISYGFAGGEAYVSLDKHFGERPVGERADLARCTRWGGGGWAVFPGEYVTGDGEDELTRVLRDMLSRTDLQNPFYSKTYEKLLYPGVPIIHPISSLVPAIRLGLQSQFEPIRQIILAHRLTTGQASSYRLSTGEIPPEVKGYRGYGWYDWRSVENKYAGVIAPTEMLLQSQGNVIRLFPLWPKNRSAEFQGLRARGGFILSAMLKKDGSIRAALLSEAGLPCRMQIKGHAAVKTGSRSVPFQIEGAHMVFETEKGRSYHVTFTAK